MMEFTRKFNEQISDLKQVAPKSLDGKNILQPFIDLFQNFLDHLDFKFTEFKAEMLQTSKAKDRKIDDLEKVNAAYKTRITALEDRLEDQCQYTRRESLVFSGDNLPECSDDEDCATLVCNIIQKNEPTIVITPTQLSIAHRLGSKPTNGKDKRSIIARFCRRKERYDVLNAVKKRKPTGIYVAESLTPSKQKMTHALHKAKKQFPTKISGYTTVDGTVYAWIVPPNSSAPGARNSRVKIDNMARLEKLFLDVLDMPVSRFMQKRTTGHDE